MTDLRRHVPPLTLTWDAEAPGARWRVVDGTLVFADVSGFTALTEKLTQRGRIGAEEIVETLNRVFGPMLRISAARGGELLKFGGDALLFLFRGPDHAEQACDAAVEMRRALRQAAAEPTSVGRLSLSMSVGVHSGDIHLFLVGSPTRELLILGPGATATAEAEKVANAGQVVVSPPTVSRLSRGAVRPREDGQMVLRRRAPHATAPGVDPVPAAAPALLRTLFPHALGDYLGPAIPDPEHRLACIAFIRFSGTDALLAGPGPDALAEALQATVSGVEAGLAPEGVTMLATDIDSDGGKFFLGTGIPAASDDNEGRMLRALRNIADAGTPLPLQLGVNRGHVFAAEVGTTERSAYTGMGDTTNTAARIMSKAPAGAIYAHPAVLEHSRTRFAMTPAGPFPMKGKAAPLLVHEVGEELGTRDEAPARVSLPFLGRDAELTQVRTALTAALSGVGGVMTIVGPAGLGKTRLVREALEGLDVDDLMVVRSEPYRAASRYRVLRDAIRHLLGIERDSPEAMGKAMLDSVRQLAPELLPMAPLLADVVQVDVPTTPEVEQLDPQYRPDRLADAVVALLERALSGSLVLVAEEAHWADAASAGLLERIASAAPGRPWAVLALRRPDPGGFTPATGARVELAPLPPEVVERLVIAATDSMPLRPHEIRAIVDRAEGNPLFVEEVSRIAVGSASLESLPESVGAALSTQIDALPPHSRRILRYCAVLGRSFRLEVLSKVLDADGLDLRPGDLAGLAEFLEPDGAGRMRFRNSLVRDAAYEGLAYRLRASMHRTAGETLERISGDLDADAAVLALHYWRAGDAERTWEYARRAGEDARRAYANVDAAELYERALEVSRRIPEVTDADRAGLWAVLGDLRESAGVLDGAEEAFRRAVALTHDPLPRAHLLSRRAEVLDRSGSPVQALRLIGRARHLLEASADEGSARALVRLQALVASIRLGQARFGPALATASSAADEARALGDRLTLASALIFADYADVLLGTSGVGERTREALEIAIESGDGVTELKARANLGGYAFYAGRWEEAVQWYRSSRDVAVKVGRVIQAAEIDLALGEILVHQGHLDEAEGVLRDAVRVLRASGDDVGGAEGEIQLARVQLARGEVAASDQVATRVWVELSILGSRVSAAAANLVRAEAALARDDPERALTLLPDPQASHTDEMESLLPRLQLIRGRALLRLGKFELASAALEVGLRSAQDQALPFEEALLLRTRVDLARDSPDAVSQAAAETDALTARNILSRLGAADGPPRLVSEAT
jgi:class 3 adenylate cyclase/tetratricopeptide (TPR) repeat protein